MSSRNTAELPARIATVDDRAACRPVYAVWELTLACNLACAHCGSRAGKKRPDELDTAQCMEVVQALRQLGTREVTLIGGEAYLHRDWLQIIRAITEAGMACTLQTGGRGLTEKRLRAARDAGLAGIGVSIDGPPEIHNRLRGFSGAFEGALSVLRIARDIGLPTAVNTTIGSELLPHLEDMLDSLIDTGVRSWRLALMVPMGRACDEPGMLVQPYQLLDLMPRIDRLRVHARLHDMEVQAGNTLGYFGPYEARLRPALSPEAHYEGCAAGVNTIGIESDGTVKGCPSLPTGPYAGGRVTDLPLEEIWKRRAPVAFMRERTIQDLRGFCRSCYYASVCKAGCSWMSHTVSGNPGDNPFCHHRALELARQGLRERVERAAGAPGLPYDFGTFRVVVEHLDGSSRDPEATPPVDQTPQRAGQSRDAESLEPCPSCRRHVFTDTSHCPFCGIDLAVARDQAQMQRENLRASHQEFVRSVQGR